MRALVVRTGRTADALDRFEDAWNRAAVGAAAAPAQALLLPDLPALLEALTPKRWQLLERLRAEGPMTIFALARRLRRNYKNVHTDVARLAGLGLVERRADGTIEVPWDAVRAELRLA
jgi:predicted transcriptional regulator